jgi:hypothetical protein
VIEAGFSLLKRKDPVVFTAGYSHDFTWPTNRNGATIDPGEFDNFNAGAVLALSPDVSLRGNVVFTFDSLERFNGAKLSGTDLVIGTVTVAASVSLSDSVLVDVALGTGITPDANNFSMTVSLPIRF